MKRTDYGCHAAGGAVRDLLLGRRRHDVDYVCIDSQEDFIQRNPEARKIENGHTCVYLLNEQEYLLLPPGSGQEESTLANDIARRDFTINSLLLSNNGVIRAHPSAFADLGNGIIRPTSSNSLLDDPVRVLRAARFSAELPSFFLHDACLEQMRSAARRGLLAGIAAEQAGRECIKACSAAMPGNFLKALAAASCLHPWFAEFASGRSKAAGPPRFHNGTVLEHTVDVMDQVAQCCAEEAGGDWRPPLSTLAVWMALCHDLGKSATSETALPRHIGHESRGGEMAYALGKRLRLPSLFCKAGKLTSELHMKAGNYSILKPGTKVDLLMRLYNARIAAPFFIVIAADSHKKQLPELMRLDLDRILAVKLPLQWENKGEASGRYLRQMRCEAISV